MYDCVETVVYVIGGCVAAAAEDCCDLSYAVWCWAVGD